MPPYAHNCRFFYNAKTNLHIFFTMTVIEIHTSKRFALLLAIRRLKTNACKPAKHTEQLANQNEIQIKQGKMTEK